MGDGASAHQHTNTIPDLGSWVRHRCLSLIHDYRCEDFLGEQVLPTASPLPFFAYPFLVITFIGWIWTLVGEKPD